jgi:hypothetical protein
MQFFPAGRISEERQSDFPTTDLLITNEERYKLSKFVREAQSRLILEEPRD